MKLFERLKPWLNGRAALVLGLLLIGVVGGVGWTRGWFGFPGAAGERQVTAENSGMPAVDFGEPTLVRLTSEKLQRAGLHVTPVVKQERQAVRTVPGEIGYDLGHSLTLTAPVDCVVREVLVEPSQVVEQGTPLVVLSSAEVGKARDEVMRREADLELAVREAEWASAIATNVKTLLGLLDERIALTEIEKQVEGKTLGEARDKLISAYSQLILAESTLGDTAALADQGVLSGRLSQERRSTRESAAAVYHSIRETTQFRVDQERNRTQAVVQQAERLLAVSREQLATLLGPFADHTPIMMKGPMNDFTLSAPLAGTVEDRWVIAAARLAAGEPLIKLADTKMLWLTAEIHERDWASLLAQVGSDLSLRVPALGNAQFTAKLRRIGTNVAPETHAIPLVAELQNPEQKLRPGMFAWVDVPTSQSREMVTVPLGAIMRHEGKAFVFIPEKELEFRRVDVNPGEELRDVIEIRGGVSPGQVVVDSGAFFLKSELLLERESE